MLTAFDQRNSKGRRDVDEKLLISERQDQYKSDIDKISQSKSNRRIGNKTQVISDPENSNVRTRGSHTNEVKAVSSILAEMLSLNVNLCEAIAEGHDVGHAPYGHHGEKILTKLSGKQFKHNIFSVVVLQDIETRGKGLNLSYETLEGILYHSRGKGELKTLINKPQEYNIVMWADKIAYTFADLSDIVSRRLGEDKVPKCASFLGNNPRKRIDTCMRALIRESKEKGEVSFSYGKEYDAFTEIRQFMFDKVYPKFDTNFHEEILSTWYNFFKENFSYIDPVIPVALLTDKDANTIVSYLAQSKEMTPYDVRNLGAVEVIKQLKGKNIDFTKADLSWGDKK
ncbi:MAG: HD domain-containing protein [Candidatus Woesearchaeota archaeon]|jgi:dGTPase